jgi:hypothetical protein
VLSLENEEVSVLRQSALLLISQFVLMSEKLLP